MAHAGLSEDSVTQEFLQYPFERLPAVPVERGVQDVVAERLPGPSEDVVLIERESEDTVGAIHDCFEGDEQAQMVVLGWSEGYRGKELRDFVGVDQAALDYATKRIRRAMTKRYPNGWK
jgi:hypothetical protein